MKGTGLLSGRGSMCGFTLVELVVAIGIASVVVAAASLTVLTLLHLTPPTSDYMVAYQQVQNAGHWLLKDINMSYRATPGDGNPILLTLDQRPTPTTEVTVTYELRPSGDCYHLVRLDDSTETVIAEHIIGATASAENDGRAITVGLTARVNDKEVTRTYQAVPRLPEEE